MAILTAIGLFATLAGVLIIESEVKATIAFGAPLQFAGLILLLIPFFWWLQRQART